MFNSWKFAAIVLGTSVVISPAHALTFNNEFSSLSNLSGATQSSWLTDISTAEAAFTSVFSDPISINISWNADPNLSSVGASASYINLENWSALKTAAVKDATSAGDFTAIGTGGSLNGSGPNNNASLYITTADAKALGLVPANAAASDGTITINSSLVFNGSNAVAGLYSFIGTAEHEISEVMGRIGLSGGSVSGVAGGQYSLLDAFSYSGAGSRSPGNGSGNYISIDGGKTLLKAYNNQQGLGGDSRDWASSATPDQFDAFGTPGQAYAGLSAIDVEELDVLGYNLITPVPEPESYAMLLAGLGVLGFSARCRKHTDA